MPTLPPARRFFILRLWKKNRKGWRESSTRDEKGGTEEARVTEEFRNDRRPVASLTDDALLRSRLQAQKDGTAVMDSKWLEIVGRCHRATPFCFSFSFSLSLSFSLALAFYLYLLWLSVSSFIPRSKLTARDVLLQRQTGAYGTSQDSRPFFARLNFRSHETEIHSKLQTARHTEYFIEYIHRAIQ